MGYYDDDDYGYDEEFYEWCEEMEREREREEEEAEEEERMKKARRKYEEEVEEFEKERERARRERERDFENARYNGSTSIFDNDGWYGDRVVSNDGQYAEIRTRDGNIVRVEKANSSGGYDVYNYTGDYIGRKELSSDGDKYYSYGVDGGYKGYEENGEGMNYKFDSEHFRTGYERVNEYEYKRWQESKKKEFSDWEREQDGLRAKIDEKYNIRSYSYSGNPKSISDYYERMERKRKYDNLPAFAKKLVDFIEGEFVFYAIIIVFIIYLIVSIPYIPQYYKNGELLKFLFQSIFILLSSGFIFGGISLIIENIIFFINGVIRFFKKV